jgi:short-subunit dehydrogenase
MAQQDLRGSVVVITGATSGIGRTVAMMMGAKGAYLVLAARRRDALQAVAAAASPQRDALAVPTDVANAHEVEALAAAAMERHGRIDVWVNDAAVSVYGRFDEIPETDFRQVIETNLLGCVHGCQSALPIMRRKGHGTIINVASMLAKVPAPYVSPYVVSKFGIRALSGCLRAELLDEPGLHVCTVHPGTIDTPLFGHVANYTGREVQAMPPVVAVERAARAVVRCAERPRRNIYVGMTARLTVLQATVLPGLTERLLARYVHKNHFADRPAVATTGNLYDGLGPDPTDRIDLSRPGDTDESLVAHDDALREHAESTAVQAESASTQAARPLHPVE